MPCPRCGGTRRVIPSPGRARCQAPILEPGRWVAGPGLTNPAAGPGRIWIEQAYRECGAEYSVAEFELTADEIANCERATLAAEDSQRLQSQQRAKFENELRAWEENVTRTLARVVDPAEAVVLAVSAFTTVTTPTDSLGYRHQVDWNGVRRILPSLPTDAVKSTGSWSSTRNAAPEDWSRDVSFWDHNAIQAWFLSNVTEQPGSDGLPVTTGGFLGGKTRRKAGWMFISGSTLVHRKYGRPMDVAVLSEGKRVFPGANSWPAADAPSEGFNACALYQMAELCDVGLPPVPTMASF